MASSNDHFLVILETGDDGFVVPLPEGETRVGRSRRNDLAIRDSSISRFHAVIVRTGDTVRVVDLMSRNPTRLLRAHEVPAAADFTGFDGPEEKAHERAIGDGDALRFGCTRAIYRGPSVAGEATRSPRRTSSDPASEPTNDAAPAETPYRVASPRKRPESGRSGSTRVPREGSDLPARVASRRRDPPRRRRPSVVVHPRTRAVGARASSHGTLAFSVVLGALLLAFGLIWWTGQRSADRREELAASTERGAASRREEELLRRLDRTLADLDAERTRLRALEVTLKARADAAGEGAEDPGLLAIQDAIRRLERERTNLESDLAAFADSRGSRADANAGRGDAGRGDAAERRAEEIARAEDDAALAEILARRERDRTAHTIVVERMAPRVKIAKKDLEALVDRLKDQVGGYAFLDASPEVLAPDLATLRAVGGVEAARAGVEVYEYSTRLVDELDHTVAFLSRRTEGLLAKAGVKPGENGGSSGSKGQDEGSYSRHGKDIEDLQRALELSAKKIEIKKSQRRRLLEMREAIADAVTDLRDADALEFFTRILVRSDHAVTTQLVAARGLEKARYRAGVPGLIHSLGHSDERLKEASHRALRTISGEDLRATRRAWLDWERSSRG